MSLHAIVRTLFQSNQETVFHEMFALPLYSMGSDVAMWVLGQSSRESMEQVYSPDLDLDLET